MTTNTPAEKARLTIPATFGYEDMPAAVAQVWATNMGASKEKADKAKLAVMEICLNAMATLHRGDTFGNERNRSNPGNANQKSVAG
jgi:anti-sigma regulatory factor (Ser/Thr protein kinase)